MHRVVWKFLVTLFLLSAGAQGLFAQYDKDVFFMRGRQALADGKYALAIENFNVLSRLDTTDYWNFFFPWHSEIQSGGFARGQK